MQTEPYRLVLAVAVLVAACSPEAPDRHGGLRAGSRSGGPGGGAAQTPGGGGGGDGAGAGAGASSCAEVEDACTPGSTDAEGGRCVTTVHASVADVGGRPLADIPLAACGGNICVSGKTDASGKAHMTVCRHMTTPAVKLEGGSRWASTATPLPAGDAAGVVDLPPLSAVPLPATGAAFPDVGQSGKVASGGAELTLPSNHATHFPLGASEPDQRGFRAVEMPGAWIDANATSGLDLEVVFGFAPLETRFDTPVAIALPNTRGWTAGAKIELFVLGFDPEGSYAPYAGWKSVGGGQVSSDGKRLTSDPGSGVSVLTMVGVRLAR